ncbi:beta strand repeat-containing protein [Vogesella sp. GCM10023246]|uniref:Uncharacterized protein n=1 Tax=Vogesella oryzagri TaxID=3160864 RepID=A0ABV1M326_9NEIS
MGNLIETVVWEAGIPYFAADAILTGGPDCPDNIPIQALANRTAFLKKQIDDAVSGALTVMYANRLKTARNIAMTGDGSWNVNFDGNGNVTAAMTLANSGVVAGTYRSVTVDGKGRVTAGSNPTTLAGYGITDAQPLDSDLTALAALVTTGFYVNTGVGTVAARTLTAGTGISIANGDGVAGNPAITNTGVTSLTGTANQVNVSAATGGVTLSLPQAIHSGAKPSFAQVALAADPTSALDAATKQYVDNMAAGLEVKTSVRAATTANIVLSGTQTIDGVALVAGDRVLVKNQGTASQNGLYLVAAGAWTRTTDADAWGELVSAFVFVESGTTNADSGWVCTVDQGGTLGNTNITWTQFAGAGTVTAGTGLSVSGNQVSLAAGSNVLALHNLASTGMVVRTGAGTVAARTLTAGAGVTVTNGDGVAGNPTVALSASGVVAGTYPKVTVDTYGRVTAGSALAAADIPALDWSKITSGLPTTLAGYGITDALSALPAGIPLDWSGLTPPLWAVVRDGAALSRASYTSLYAALCPARNGTLTNGANTVTGLSTTLDMWVGMPVEGVGVPAGATVASITSNSAITLSANATATGVQSLRLFPFGYGNGGSATTFGVPDDRGLHTRAYDSGRGYEQSTLTANTTNASNVLAGITSTRGLYVGMPVSGAGIPASTTISEIVSAVSVKLSANATATASAVALTVTGRQVGAEGTDAIQNITGGVADTGTAVTSVTGAFQASTSGTGYWTGTSTGGADGFTFDASRVARTGPETQVKRRIYLPIITLGD